MLDKAVIHVMLVLRGCDLEFECLFYCLHAELNLNIQFLSSIDDDSIWLDNCFGFYVDNLFVSLSNKEKITKSLEKIHRVVLFDMYLQAYM